MTRITDISGSFALHNGVAMPYLGLGVYQIRDGKEVRDAVKWAIGLGYRHIDTASLYRNETGVGQALRESGIPRNELFVVSKVWNADQGYENTLRAFETSIRKLDTDYLDLYLVHWPVKGKYSDTWKAFERLYKEKRVRAIGVSNFLEPHLRDLMGTSEIVPMVNQMEFHPYLVQQELVDFCNDHHIQYEAWAPLMQGRILGLPVFEELAAKYRRTIAQIVLRWDLQKGVITIPKSSRKERIKRNSEIFDFELAEEEMAFIDQLDQGKRFGPDPDGFQF